MTDEELEGIIARLRRLGRDDAEVEVKASVLKLSTDVWESVSAFANTSGGLIVLGIDESAGFLPAAGFDPPRVLEQFVEGIGDGGKDGSRLTNPPRYTASMPEFEGSRVLVLQIAMNPPGTKPCFITAKGLQAGAFRRVGDRDQRLSALEVFELQNELVPSPADREVLHEATIDDLDSGLIERFVDAQAGSRALKGVDEDLHIALRRLGVIDAAGGVRMAGLLTLGRYPQEFFPKLHVDVTVHQGREKSPASSPVRFVDRQLCEGPLGEMVDEAVRVVARNLRTYSTVVGTRRTDQLEVPLSVLREGIANAVVHREYGALFSGQSVSVDVYADRIEIISPGGLWGGITEENIADGVSACRNATLMKIVRALPHGDAPGGVAEGQGSGVPLIVHEMIANALPEPVFRASPASVLLRLGRHGLEIPAHREWLAQAAGRDVSPTEAQALLLVRELGDVDAASIRDSLQIDSDEARRILAQLTSAGALVQTAYGWSLPGETSNGHDIDMPGASRTTPPGHRRHRSATAKSRAVLEALDAEEPRTIREISRRTGSAPTTLRPHLRRLLDEGVIVATAPPTSRHRAYLLSTHA